MLSKQQAPSYINEFIFPTSSTSKLANPFSQMNCAPLYYKLSGRCTCTIDFGVSLVSVPIGVELYATLKNFDLESQNERRVNSSDYVSTPISWAISWLLVAFQDRQSESLLLLEDILKLFSSHSVDKCLLLLFLSKTLLVFLRAQWMGETVLPRVSRCTR